MSDAWDELGEKIDLVEFVKILSKLRGQNERECALETLNWLGIKYTDAGA